MKFYCGGHIGDVLYALYTIKKAGGGDLILGPHQTQMWGSKEINALLPLCRYQSYITSAVESDHHVTDVDHDFCCIGGIHNPDDFFEWHGRSWPGNAHLKKRYFNSYFAKKLSLREQMLLFDGTDQWIDAPFEVHQWLNPTGYVIFHAPVRKLLRDMNRWHRILEAINAHGLVVLVIGGDNDINEWPDKPYYTKLVPDNFLHAATLIKYCNFYIGVPSCNYVIAEAMNKIRFIDMHPNTHGAEPLNLTGWDITAWTDDRVIKSCIAIAR